MTTSDNRAKFAAFINTKEVAGWLLEFKVESTKATYHQPVSILERVYLQEVSYPMGLDSGGKGSAKVR